MPMIGTSNSARTRSRPAELAVLQAITMTFAPSSTSRRTIRTVRSWISAAVRSPYGKYAESAR